MRTSIKYALLGVICFAMASCKLIEEDLGYRYRESYLTHYTQIDKNTIDDVKILSYKTSQSFEPYFRFYHKISLTWGAKTIACVESTDVELTENFKELSNHYGDNTYNRKVMDFRYHDERALADQYAGIQIVSDADFDENHPAGSSLADIIMCLYGTYWPYIQSNYLDTPDNSHAKSVDVLKRINELTVEDLTLIRTTDKFCFELYILNTPTLATQHNLTITMTTVEGEEYKYIVPVDFNTPEQ